MLRVCSIVTPPSHAHSMLTCLASCSCHVNSNCCIMPRQNNPQAVGSSELRTFRMLIENRRRHRPPPVPTTRFPAPADGECYVCGESAGFPRAPSVSSQCLMCTTQHLLFTCAYCIYTSDVYSNCQNPPMSLANPILQCVTFLM